MEPVGDVERSRALRSAGDLRGARELLKTRVRADRGDAAARLELVRLYRDAGAPDQAGRWGITLPGVITHLERDRLARMLAAARWWGGEPSEILALPKGRRPDAVEELLSGPVEEYWERMRIRFPDIPEPRKTDHLENAWIGSWLGTVGVLLLGLVALWLVAGLELLDPAFVARALGVLGATTLAVALILSGAIFGREKRLSAVPWVGSGVLLLVAAVAYAVLTRFTFRF